ncbi:ATP-binding protein [Devosia sp.]|uniref:ATP-binding protein n=1 Tax=Devosia sp. TaxID=1871048 RepID=UPI0027339420|nr:ATP-binding protein [Devosia sp.]MDP2779770.1 ATP-binding protein [Devosia sp.]
MTEQNGTPWVDDLKTKLSAGVMQAVILHGEVRDYVHHNTTLRQRLTRLFDRCEVIAFYNRSEGLTVALPSMKAKAVKALGLDTNAQSDPFLPGNTPQTPEDIFDNLPKDPSSCLPLIEQLLKTRTDLKDSNGNSHLDENGKVVYGELFAAVVIEFAETIAPATDKAMMSPPDRTNLVTLLRWGLDKQIESAKNIVVLTTGLLTELHPDLRAASAKYEAFLIPLPGYDDRLDYIEYLRGEYKDVALAVPAAELAAMTAGLSRLHIEDLFLRAGPGTPIDRDLVTERKGSIIASEYADVIEIIEPTEGFESIGGLDYVKDWAREDVIAPMLRGDYRRVPMGALLCGPAGTGKTAFVKALAKEAGINCVELKPSKILGGIVGQSEHNMEKALRCIEAMSPTIVFIDELDQTMRRGEGGSSGGDSVNNNLFKRLLEFLGNTQHRGKIFFLGATNRPDLIDAAVKRPGRIDVKLPFLVPDAGTRPQILKALLNRHSIALLPGPNDAECAPRLIAQTDDWTGAELEMLVLKAWRLAGRQGRDSVDYALLLDARGRLKKSTADIRTMTDLALAEVSDLDLVPPAFRERASDKDTLQASIAAGLGSERRGRREL